MSILYDAKTSIFHLSGTGFSYCLKISPEGQLLNLYWGRAPAPGRFELSAQEL